jgi:hypothetical protein
LQAVVVRRRDYAEIARQRERNVHGVNRYLEPTLAIGSSIIAEPIAGIAGLASLPFGGAEVAAQAVEDVTSALTFIPPSEAGIEGMEAVGDSILGAFGEAFIDASQKSGDFAYDVTGSPAAAAAAHSLPTAALEALGINIFGKAGKAAAKANMHTPKMTLGGVKLKSDHVKLARNELARRGIDIDNLVGPEKSAATRYAKALGVPAVARREGYRQTGGTEIERTALGDRNIVTPEDLEGSVLVPVVGDRSLTGGTLTQVGGVPLDRSVMIEGGPDFPLERQGTGLGWASMPGAASSKQANITKAAMSTGRDPIGVYSAMGPDAINFSTPVAEAMVSQIPALKIPKKMLREFDKEVRKIDPSFVGLESTEVFDQMMGRGEYPMNGAGALRKTIVTEMSKAKWRDKGFPVYEDVAEAVTDSRLSDLEVGDSGFSMFEGIPNQELAIDPGHQSYSRGIPGEYVGGLEQSLPPEVMFPDVMDSLSQQINKAGVPLPREQRVGALRSKHLWQEATPEWVDNASTYLEQARKALNEGGMARLTELTKNGTVPAAVASAVIMEQEVSGSSDEELSSILSESTYDEVMAGAR